jgi:rhodanese-related sulfurtransferase
MKRALSQILVLGAMAVVLGLGRNTLAPGRISWVGTWTHVSLASDSIVPPPSYQPDDPPLLTFAEAETKYQEPGVVFLDARDPEDYAAGHIPNSLALPFEDFDTYWPAVQDKITKDQEIVTYCSGADCELSLFLARHLREIGYKKISIFFGGWLKWQNEKMPVDSGGVAPPAGQGA